MSLGTRTDETSGIVTTNNSSGFSVARSTSNVGFGPYKVDSIQALTASSTLVAGDAGVNTVSGSSVITLVMPTVASAPGAEFIFRNLSAHAHVLTASQESLGTKSFLSIQSGSVGFGSKLTLSSSVGCSVVLKCDGLVYHVLSYSGSIAISGT